MSNPHMTQHNTNQSQNFFSLLWYSATWPPSFLTSSSSDFLELPDPSSSCTKTNRSTIIRYPIDMSMKQWNLFNSILKVKLINLLDQYNEIMKLVLIDFTLPLEIYCWGIMYAFKAVILVSPWCIIWKLKLTQQIISMVIIFNFPDFWSEL